MRLKTKLVLAITTLVFLICGMLSLVYVSQLLHAAVQQSYDTNHMVAEPDAVCPAECARDRAQRPDRRSQQSRPVAHSDDRGGAQQRRAAGRGRVGQPLLAHRLRHQHRRQPVHHAAQHQSRERRQAAAGAARLQAASQCHSAPADAGGLRSAQGLRRGGASGTQRRALCHRACGRAHHAAARLLCAVAHRGAHADGPCAAHGSVRGLPAEQSGAAAHGEISRQLDYLAPSRRRNGRKQDRRLHPGRTRRPRSPPRSSSSASACAMWKRSSPR